MKVARFYCAKANCVELNHSLINCLNYECLFNLVTVELFVIVSFYVNMFM